MREWPEGAGIDGGITNFLDDIAEEAAGSNGFVLEIGVATGTGSTMAIQEGLKAHHNPLHVSVDQRDYMSWKPQVPWWHFVIGDSRSYDTLTAVCHIKDQRRPGLIYIDTDHDYAQMSSELLVWSLLAADHTVWLFHDTWMFGPKNESMVKAITEFADANGWQFVDYKTEPHGLGMMVKR